MSICARCLRDADGDSAAPAIGASDRKTMSRAELLRLVERTGGALRALGIQQKDAVAMVMPNGPEMAAAFVAAASWAAAAPLNAGYRAPTNSTSISAISMPRR